MLMAISLRPHPSGDSARDLRFTHPLMPVAVLVLAGLSAVISGAEPVTWAVGACAAGYSLSGST